jgi:hypothetical protein
MTVNVNEAEITYAGYGGTMTTRIKNDAHDIVIGEELMKKLIKTSPLLTKALREIYGGIR